MSDAKDGSGLRLYSVLVEVQLMVLAADESEASALGLACAGDELKNDTGDVSVADVVEYGVGLGHWKDCFPYAEDQSAVQKTCGEWLAARAEASKEEP